MLKGVYKRTKKHAHNFIDRTGQKYGNLTVISYSDKNKHGQAKWVCKCDCGNEIVVIGGSLTSGHTKTCGCLHSMYGKNHTEETKKKMSEANKGKKHYRWNSNLTNEERKIKRNYPEYKEWRSFIYERDNYTCQKCNQVGGKLNVHHIEGYNSNKKLRITLSNGVTWCKECHDNFHHQFGKGNNTRKQFEEFINKKYCLY